MADGGVGRVREVYVASYRRLVGQLTGVTGDPLEAEDVVMEAFARAVTRHREFARVDNPEAWLRTVAVNVARSRWRRLIRMPTTPLELADGDRSSTAYDDLPADRVALLAALRALPAAQREAIALHHLADLPVHEVAATLGVPTGTVKARLARGRARLADLLGQPEEEEHHVRPT
jgi:RNA polymerase sigma-70 factor (ECF subfamily)